MLCCDPIGRSRGGPGNTLFALRLSIAIEGTTLYPNGASWGVVHGTSLQLRLMLTSKATILLLKLSRTCWTCRRRLASLRLLSTSSAALFSHVMGPEFLVKYESAESKTSSWTCTARRNIAAIQDSSYSLSNSTSTVFTCNP